MEIEKNKDIKKLNQFGVSVKVKYFVELKTKRDLTEYLNSKLVDIKTQIIGEGNNILFVDDFDGVLLKPNFKGMEIIRENDKNIWIKIFSGEDWDKIVHWAVENQYQGIENMVLIPSSIGGAVTQNIAAYGQNLMDVIEEVHTVNIVTKEEKVFNNKECEFRYRDSIFKSQLKNQYLVVSVTIKLNKYFGELETSYHERKSRYGSLEEELKTFASEPYSIENVMQAVINQRQKKLPSIDEYGTCGSIFANPVVTKEKYIELSNEILELQSYPVDKLQYTKKEWSKIEGDSVKVPAGRILDELGWRGKWEGNVGVHDRHALCVVTNRQATGKEIFDFLKKIRKSVKDKYGISLNYEINIIN